MTTTGTRVQDLTVGTITSRGEVATITKRGATFFVTFTNGDFRTCSWGAVFTPAA